MTTPSYIGTGYTSDGQGAVSLKISARMKIASRLKVNIGTPGSLFLTPTYGTNVAGDLFLAEVYARNLSSALVVPDGWTQHAGPSTFGNSSSYWLTRDARSSGGEMGGAVFAVGANSGLAAIHTFRDVALAAFFESLSNDGSAINTFTVNAPTVNASGNDRLAVAAGGAGEIVTVSAFTGQTGGTWVLNYSEFTIVGNNSSMWLQTADLSGGGTISGGSYLMSSEENWSQQGFALVG